MVNRLSPTVRRLAAIALNLIIVVSTVLAIGIYFVGGPDILGSWGVLCFRYFTTDSNVLMAVAAVIALFYQLRGKALPRWVALLLLAATTAVTVTLLTVVFFLGPTAWLKGGGLRSYLYFFAGNTLALHLTTPLAAILAFTLFEREPALSGRLAWLGVVPTFLYSIAYVYAAVITKQWPDFYGFTFGGHDAIAPVSACVMYLASFGFAAALLRMRRGKKIGG